MPDLTRSATQVTGHVYRYDPISEAEWLEIWRQQGRPDWALEAGLTSCQALRAGEFDVVSDDYRRLTGRDPATIAQVIAALANEMPLAAKRRPQ